MERGPHMTSGSTFCPWPPAPLPHNPLSHILLPHTPLSHAPWPQIPRPHTPWSHIPWPGAEQCVVRKGVVGGGREGRVGRGTQGVARGRGLAAELALNGNALWCSPQQVLFNSC